MADTTQDIIKADPIGALKEASKISLRGGGAFLAVGIAGVYAQNHGWSVNFWLVLTCFIAAALLGIMSGLSPMYDAKLRTQLATKLIEVKGTADVKKADELPHVLTQVLHKPLIEKLALDGNLDLSQVQLPEQRRVVVHVETPVS